MLKKEKKKEKTQRYDKSHICPNHLQCATLNKVVMCGVVSDIVNRAVLSFIKISSKVFNLSIKIYRIHVDDTVFRYISI